MEICNLSIVNNQIINNSDIVDIVIVLYWIWLFRKLTLAKKNQLILLKPSFFRCITNGLLKTSFKFSTTWSGLWSYLQMLIRVACNLIILTTFSLRLLFQIESNRPKKLQRVSLWKPLLTWLMVLLSLKIWNVQFFAIVFFFCFPRNGCYTIFIWPGLANTKSHSMVWYSQTHKKKCKNSLD